VPIEFFFLENRTNHNLNAWNGTRICINYVPYRVAVTPRVMPFSNYLHYKLNQVSSALVDQVVEIQNQNSKSGVQI
jgi:hypothetical protein